MKIQTRGDKEDETDNSTVNHTEGSAGSRPCFPSPPLKGLFVNCHSANLSSLTHFHALSPSQGLSKQESSLPAHQHWSLGLKSICCKWTAPLLKQPGYSLSLSVDPRDCMCRIWLLCSTHVHTHPHPQTPNSCPLQ